MRETTAMHYEWRYIFMERRPPFATTIQFKALEQQMAALRNKPPNMPYEAPSAASPLTAAAAAAAAEKLN